MSEQEALEKFGQFLMTKVRDEAITDWRMIADGTMKSQRAQDLRQTLAGVPEDHRSVLLGLVPEIVDTVLHHLMWGLEQEGDIDVAIQVNESERIESLRDASDGLSGELYSDSGWIASFSKESKKE